MTTYFPNIANYAAFPQGSTVNGSVTFTPGLTVGAIALVTGATPPLGEISAPTQAAIVNGNLQTSPTNAAPVLLLAQTSDLNLSGTLQYTASFQIQVGGRPVPVPGFVFNAQVPRTTADAAMTNASTTLTSATAAFISADVGAVVTVAGAFAAGTIVTIVSVTNSTTVVLSSAATATVSAAALSVCRAIDLITVTPAAPASAIVALSPTTFGTALVQLPNSAALIALLGLGGGQDTYLGTAASQAAMLALTGPQGSWTIRTDSSPNTVWYLTGTPASSLGSWTELPAITVSAFNADNTTTVSAVNTWLAQPVAGGGVHRLQGALTLNAPLVIGSDTELDATGATITQTPGTNQRMIKNTAVTPLRSTVGNAVCVAGSHTVTTATGAFTSADIGRVLQVAFLDEAGFGSNAYGTITAINSGTSVEIDSKPLKTQSGGVARVYSRDKNIHIRGGVWDHGTNDGGKVNGNFIHLRRIDGGSISQVECRSTAGGAYAMSLGDLTDFDVDEPHSDVFSDFVHFTGPGRDIRVRNVRGRSGDDRVAFVTSEYPVNNDCHGSFEDLLIEDIVGVAPARRLVLLSGSCLNLDGSLPALPDGHSIRRVKVSRVSDTSSDQSSAGVTTWVQSDDPGARIEDLAITDANCHVNLFHNAHGKVLLENVTGNIKVASMPSPYPNTAAVIDDLTITNCSDGIFDTNDTRATITKLTVRGGASPLMWLACHAVGSVLMDRVTFTSRLFLVNNGCAVGVMTFDHCMGSMGSTDGLGSVEGSSSVGEVNFRACNLVSTATTNDYLAHVTSGSTLGTLRVEGSTITGMKELLANEGAAQVLLFLSDVSVVGGERIAFGSGGAVVKYSGVYFDGTLTPFYADGPMTLSGAGFGVSAAAAGLFTDWLTVAGGTVHVLDPHFQVRVDTLAKTLGDMAFNTNGGLSVGWGPALSDGSNWKNLYTGATY